MKTDPFADGDEAKISWLLVISQNSFDAKFHIRMEPSWTKQIGDAQILQYIATNQEINKIALDLKIMLAMMCPSQRQIIMIIDREGILWQDHNNRITGISKK